MLLGISSSTSCSPAGGGDARGALAGWAAGGGSGARAELSAFRLATAVRRGRPLAARVEGGVEAGVGEGCCGGASKSTAAGADGAGVVQCGRGSAAGDGAGAGGGVNPRLRRDFLGGGAAEGAGVPFSAGGGGADMAAGGSRAAAVASDRRRKTRMSREVGGKF